MGMTVAKFRREVLRRREGRKRGAGSYPPRMRQFAVAHAVSVRSAGGSVHRAARELGISEVTLASWLRAEPEAPKLREVRVAASPVRSAPTSASTGTVVLTAPSGHVVSGLSVQQAAELLRALS